jgi:hypothetical protein
MPPSLKRNPRKIEPFDLDAMAKSFALRGMTSFLDVSPEEIRARNQNNMSTGDKLTTGDSLTPVDKVTPIVSLTVEDNVSTGDRLSIVDSVTTDDNLSTDDNLTPIDNVTPDDMLTVGDNMSTGDTMSIGDNLSIDDNPVADVSPMRGRVFIGVRPSTTNSPGLSPMVSPMVSPMASPMAVPPRQGMVAGSVATRNRKIVPCRFAQDGHTVSEEAVYRVMYDRTTAEDRTVRMGYSELSDRTRLSKRTIARIIPVLCDKLSIERIGDHRAGDLVPKLYRVYTYKEILDRRRERGLEFVIRGSSVIFVNISGEPIDLNEGREGKSLSTGDNMSTGDMLTTGDKLSSGDRMTPIDKLRVAEELGRYWSVDDAATDRLIQACLSIRPDLTTEELLYFVIEKRDMVRSNRHIHSPTGFLLSAIPPCFAGVAFETFRTRQAERRRIEAEEIERKRQDDIRMLEWCIDGSRRILADPKTDAARRQREEKDMLDAEARLRELRAGKGREV